MSRKLELVREEKLFRLLPGRKESSRLEASGVALLDDATALVIFDNLNWVARIDLSVKRSAGNRLLPAPSLGLGFEDIAIDHKGKRFFCLIEELEDVDGLIRSFVAEYDSAGNEQTPSCQPSKYQYFFMPIPRNFTRSHGRFQLGTSRGHAPAKAHAFRR